MYLQQGGVKSALEVLSMADHAAILRVLHEAMEQEKQQIYDITGISDIVRGVSRASETLGAQQIKTQYAMSRISERQRKVAKFCRDVVSLIAQVVKNHFQADTMIKMAGVSNDPDLEEYLGGVIDLLRNDTQSDYRIDIETDSTTFANQEAAKQSAIDLTNALGNLFNVLLPHAQAIPQLMPVINELTLYTTSQFEAGREVKGKLEKALTEVESEMDKARQEQKAVEEQQRQMQMQQMQQGIEGQNQENAQAQAELQQAQSQAQAQAQQMAMEQQMAQMDAQYKAQIENMKLSMKAQELQVKQEMEAQKLVSKEQIEAAKLQAKRDIEAAKLLATQESERQREISKMIQNDQKNQADVRKTVVQNLIPRGV